MTDPYLTELYRAEKRVTEAFGALNAIAVTNTIPNYAARAAAIASDLAKTKQALRTLGADMKSRKCPDGRSDCVLDES